VRVRPERKHDAAAIRNVQYNAFNDHPYTYKDEYKIVDALRKSDSLTLSLVAEEYGAGIVGQLTISPVLINGHDEGWFYVGPVGVLPEHQRKGIGTSLIRQAVRAMYTQRANGLISHGDPKFFTKLGFRNDSRITYKNVQPEHIVLLPLGKSVPEGAVVLHTAHLTDYL
jgi:putative acetyltransferase